jgi:hypothetical protein
MPQAYQQIGDNRSVQNGNPFDVTRQPTFPSNTERVTEANRGFILTSFMFISAMTSLSASLCLIAVISYIAILFGDNLIATVDDAIQAIIVFFDVLLCIFVIFIEMEWTETIRSISLLQSWPVRGMVYIFIGLGIFENLGGVNHTVLRLKHVGYLVYPSLVIAAFGGLYASMVSRSVFATKTGWNHGLVAPRVKSL